MDWMTDEIINKAKSVLDTNPVNLRKAIAGSLGITEYKAREIIRKIEDKTPDISCPTFGVFDLETTALEAHFGRLLCCSVLSVPSMEVKTFRWDDYSNRISDDRALAVAIRDHLEAHNITVGWYTKGFDIGFLRGRLAYWGERLLKSQLHFDPMWGYRGWRGVKIGSSSMKNVAEFLHLDEQKYNVPKEVWVNAGTGDIEALETIIERCESDVRVTWEIAQHCLDNNLLKNPFQMYP